MRRRGFTLVETLVALGVFALLVGAWWGVIGILRRGEAKLTDRACALASTEIALARLSIDVASMLPPDPFRPEHCPALAADGGALEFLRCERASGGMAARRVRYERRGDRLLRDGRPLPGVQIAAFAVALAAGAHGEPRLRVSLAGVSGPERHAVEVTLALPPPGPAATVGLPEGASAVLGRAIKETL